MKLNWGSSPSEYVQLASQAGGDNRTESAGGFPGAGQGPTLWLSGWQREPQEGVRQGGPRRARRGLQQGDR